MKVWLLPTERAGKVIALLLFFMLHGAAQATSSSAPVAAPATLTVAASVQPDAKARNTRKKPPKSEWNKLTPAQQTALAPLEHDWPRLDSFRKEKWLELANRFTSMSPEEQARMQKRMRDWVKLSPEQRRLARESYARSKKMNAQQKSQQWERYQQLSEEKKKQLAATAKPKKQIANPPRPRVSNNGAQTHSQRPASKKQSLPTTHNDAAIPTSTP